MHDEVKQLLHLGFVFVLFGGVKCISHSSFEIGETEAFAAIQYYSTL
jgi:hypothetical protein